MIRVSNTSSLTRIAISSALTGVKTTSYINKPLFRMLSSFNTPRSNGSEYVAKKYTADDEVNENVRMATFLKKVYLTTGLGVISTVGIAAVLPPFVAHLSPLFLIGTGFVGSIGSIYAINSIPSIPRIHISKDSTDDSNVSPLSLTLAGLSLISFQALSISPLVNFIMITQPSVIPLSIGVTSFIFAGSSAYALYSPSDSFLQFKAPLFGSLFGLVGIGVSSIGASYMGFSEIAASLHSINLYGGLLLFTALNAYDTHSAIAQYREGDKCVIKATVAFYLNAQNILIRVMQIMAEMNKMTKD